MMKLNSIKLNSKKNNFFLIPSPFVKIEDLQVNEDRTISAKVLVDWNKDGTYSDETYYLQSIEIERFFTEPFGGFMMSQADVVLLNTNNRYTPDNISKPVDIFAQKKRLLLKNGLNLVTKNNQIVILRKR